MSSAPEIAPEMNRRFQRSPETESVLALMKACPGGEAVTYEAASRASRVSDSKKLRDLVRRCGHIALREFGAVFWSIQNTGVRHLLDSEIATFVGPEHRKRLAKATRKAKRRLLAVKDFKSLTDEQRAQWNTSMVLASVVEHVASAKTAQKVLVEIDDKARFSLATDSLFESFKK